MRYAISKGLRFAILERDGFRCRACGQSPLKQNDVILHVDHIFPVAKGGTNHPSNLQTLCEDCNSGKKARVVVAMIENAPCSPELDKYLNPAPRPERNHSANLALLKLFKIGDGNKRACIRRKSRNRFKAEIGRRLNPRMDGSLDGWAWPENLGIFETAEDAEQAIRARASIEDATDELNLVRQTRQARKNDGYQY